MRRRRATLRAALGISALLALSGCSDRETALTFTTGPKGGLYEPLGNAMARAIQAENPHLEVRVVESRGSQENVERLDQRQADLALVQNDSPGTPAIRSIAPVYRDVLHFLARRDSSIEQLADIRGGRVAVGEQGSGTETVVRHLTQHYGLSYEDFEPLYLGPNDATDQLIGGKIDAMLFMVGLRSPACERAVSSGQVRFVGLGEAGIDAGEVAGFRLEYPFVEPFVIPIYTYAAQGGLPGEPPAPVAALATQNVLVCHVSVPDDVATAITAALFNHRAELVRTHQVAAQLTDRFDPASLHFPLHSGARAFYERDEPSFFVRYAEVMAFGLSALIAMGAVIAALGRIIARHKKNLIDLYYEELEQILDDLETQSEHSLEELEQTGERLRTIRRKAFDELIAERLKADESFRIFQALLRECQLQVRRLQEQLASSTAAREPAGGTDR